MPYSIVRMKFDNPARFGIKSLNDTFSICHSDTLFSSIFIETMNLYGIEQANKLKQEFEKGSLAISSTLPYLVENEQLKLFVPKPILYFEPSQESEKIEKEEKSIKKIVKQIEFVRISELQNYIKDLKEKNIQNIEKYANKTFVTKMDTKVNMEKGENQVYDIVTNIYGSKLHEAGLYFVLYSEQEENTKQMKQILTSLQYTGIGGKKSTGYGHFTLTEFSNLKNTEDSEKQALYEAFQRQGNYYMLFSLLSLSDQEIEQIDLDVTYYNLLRRSGFVDSYTYSNVEAKKREIYMLEEGSCLKEKYKGEIKDVSANGNHPVWKYGKGMYIGIN